MSQRIGFGQDTITFPYGLVMGDVVPEFPGIPHQRLRMRERDRSLT